MSELPPARRAENMRLREAATPGPWIADHRARVAGIYAGERVNCFDEVERFIAYRNHAADLQDEHDWQYMATAANDLPLYEAALANAELYASTELAACREIVTKRAEKAEAALAEAEREIERLNGEVEYYKSMRIL